jgi:hypothetical protein
VKNPGVDVPVSAAEPGQSLSLSREQGTRALVGKEKPSSEEHLLFCRHDLEANTVRSYNKDRVAVYIGLETGHHALDGRKGCFRGKVFDGNPEVVNRLNWAAFTMHADGIARRPESKAQLRWIGRGGPYPKQLLVKLLSRFQIGDRNLNMVDASWAECTDGTFLR